MKKSILFLLVSAAIFTSCQKKVDEIVGRNSEPAPPAAAGSDFLQYIIKQGQQYSNYSSYAQVSLDQQSFVVRFDSSAIYQTADPSNQNDINKLFGFSDNNAQHHEFSARFGWRWSNNALRLFAYVYNNSVRVSKELGTVDLGAENHCSIKVSGDTYLFSLNGVTTTMPRASSTANAEGYKLFPYFGGDELAPHTISIWIKEIKL
jgi:hypothetical protein